MKNRIVIKIGSDTITAKNELDYAKITSLARDITVLKHIGYEILLVSSGAIASGMKKLGRKKKADDVVEKRMLAAVGQCYLIEAWIGALHPIITAQVLLTIHELKEAESSRKAKETLERLLSEGIVPVINENDAIADEEIRFSDNDQLAVRLAKLVKAERLVILTNVDGFFNKDPKKFKDAELVKRIDIVDNQVISLVGDSNSKYGTGGMGFKLIAAKEAAEAGITTNIIGAKDGYLVSLIRDNKDIGTEILKSA